MNCRTARQFLDDYLDNVLDEEIRIGFRVHTESCPACRSRLEREQALREALRNLPVPVPDPGFSRRVFSRAAATRRHLSSKSRMSQLMRMAASILVVVAIGAMVKMIWPIGRTDGPEAFVSLNRPEEVRLVFNSEKTLKNVTLSLEPPPGVDVVGFEDQRVIVWQVDLKQGKNLLVLPVIARDRQGGPLMASIRDGSRNKQFRLRLKVTSPDDRRPDIGDLETRLVPVQLV